MILVGEEKKKSMISHVLRGEKVELRVDRAYDCGCNSGSPLGDVVGSLKIDPIPLWNSILPEPGQPSAQLSGPIRLTACKKALHAISRGIGQFISLG